MKRALFALLVSTLVLGCGTNTNNPSLKIVTKAIESEWDSFETNNHSLCWIKTIKHEATLPFNIGYYFSDYPAKNGKLYYSNSLDGDVREVCNFSKEATGEDVNIESSVVAVSPKHNSVITSVFDVYPGRGLWIYEDGEYRKVDFEEPMQGWLYNVGIEFVYDEDGNEYCIYGEYSHARKATRRIFRGRYPYSQRENWEAVYTIKSSEEDSDRILHIHHIHKDPWSKYIYCCCGDSQAESRWFYSADCGKTWQLLVKNLPGGYLRCTNVIFTETDIWWASDDMQHFLMHASRDANGLVDAKTIASVCKLPSKQATNATAYIKSANCLFFYDRRYDGGVLQYTMYSIDNKRLMSMGGKKDWQLHELLGQQGQVLHPLSKLFNTTFGDGNL